DYTPGRALNTGARATTAPVLLALSSHTLAPDERWVERCLEHHSDPSVAGCCGLRFMPDATLLFDPIRVDASRIREHPYWGFSNTASSWRRDVWEKMPFDEEM